MRLFPVKECGGRKQLVYGDDTGTTDTHHENITLIKAPRLGYGLIEPELLDSVGPCRCHLARRNNLHESWTFSIYASEVLVARCLMNLCLSTEFGLHGVNRQTARLLPAVTTALAYRFVDHDPNSGFGHLAALSIPTELGRAWLIVDQHRGPRGIPENTLRFVQSITVPDPDAFGETRRGWILVRIFSTHNDVSDTLGFDGAGELGHRHPPVDILATGHCHGRVVEDFVGDVGSHGHGLSQCQGA
jgi:hypothetical protein